MASWPSRVTGSGRWSQCRLAFFYLAIMTCIVVAGTALLGSIKSKNAQSGAQHGNTQQARSLEDASGLSAGISWSSLNSMISSALASQKTSPGSGAAVGNRKEVSYTSLIVSRHDRELQTLRDRITEQNQQIQQLNIAVAQLEGTQSRLHSDLRDQGRKHELLSEKLRNSSQPLGRTDGGKHADHPGSYTDDGSLIVIDHDKVIEKIVENIHMDDLLEKIQRAVAGRLEHSANTNKGDGVEAKKVPRSAIVVAEDGNSQQAQAGDSIDPEEHAAIMKQRQYEDDNFIRPGQIRYVNNYLCMDGYSPTKVILWYCSRDQPAQFWTYTKHNQLQTTTEEGNIWCLDAAGGTLRPRACNAAAESQQFDFIPQQNYLHNITGVFRLRNTDQCITNPSLYGEDTATISMDTCTQEMFCRQLFAAQPFLHDASSATSLSEAIKPSVQRNPAPVHTYETMGGKGGKIFCWVMTNPKNREKADAVSETWGRHCDELVFVTTKPWDGLETWLIDLPGPESRDYLWLKSKTAWMRAYRTKLSEYDWFIRGDDDTFLLMDNMREYLSNYDADGLHFFGRLFESSGHQFYGGGSGTIVSRGALRRLGKAVEAQGSRVFSPGNTFADDMEIGISMASIGVPLQPQVDGRGGNLFMGVGLAYERMMKRGDGGDQDWFWDYSVNQKEGPGCCSTSWLGTHYVAPTEMFLLEELHNVGCEGTGVDLNL